MRTITPMANSRRKCCRCGRHRPIADLNVTGIQARCLEPCTPAAKPAPKPRRRLAQRSKKKIEAAPAEAAVRAEVFARDDRCRLEGVEGAGPCMGRDTFHHILKAGQGGKYTAANGAKMCVLHNDRLEYDADLAALARSMGLVIRRGDLASRDPHISPQDGEAAADPFHVTATVLGSN